MTLAVRRATLDELDTVARLFDLYRVFYGKASDPALAMGLNVQGGVLRNAGVARAFPDLPYAPYEA